MTKTTLIILGACVVAYGSARLRSTQSSTAQDIDKAAASGIAKESAVQAYGVLDGYAVVPCEDDLLWRVFFDPTEADASNGGLEYIIVKRGGRIISHRKLPLVGPNYRQTSPTSEINKTQAIAIAKKDGVKAYGSLEHYRVTVCELSKAWAVIYSPARGSNGGGPEYVIDKRDGRILDRKYYQ